MRTARSSSRWRGSPPGIPLEPDSLGAGTPPPRAGTPLVPDPPDQTPPDQAPPRTRPPPRGQTHTCKHITLPQTSFAGGKNTVR